MDRLDSPFSESDLLQRLTTQARSSGRNIVFLVGSPLVAPVRSGELGVPGVTGMIELIKEELEGQLELEYEIPARRYQEAFRRLLGRRGPDGPNRIVRRAVLRARQRPPAGAELEAAEAGKPEVCDALERDVGGWALNPAVASLGTILAEYPEQFGKVLLTSNFDPLIEVSLRKAGAGGFRTITLYTDASLGWSRGDGCNVVHFHGYWSDSDTFHMPGQLQHSRPQLSSSLAALLRERTVVVAAYGGWDDVFTRALTSVSQEAESFPDVLWLFRETDPEQIRESFQSRIKSLEPAVIRGRLLLYGGIDVLSFFPKLLASLRASVPRKSSLPSHGQSLEPPELADPLDLPPHDGLPAQLSMEALPALSIRESNLRALPLDLGTAWGLERGAFSMLLAGGAEERAYRTLVRSEEALWRASRGGEDLPSLPIRWWIRIGPELPRAPETMAEVWAAARDRESARLVYLRRHGLHKNLLPGFFLVAPAAANGLPPELLLWWKALLRIFAALPVAIAAHLDAPPGEALADEVKGLERRVGASEARLDIVRLLDREQDAEPVATVATPLPALAQGLERELALTLGIETGAERSSRATGGDQVAALIRRLESPEAAPSAGSVYEFLTWVSQRCPELIRPLLRASARSAHPAVQRGSLTFAAQTDFWMDAWLDGADLQDAGLEDLAGVADPAGRPVFEDLVLALMRRSRRATDAARSEWILAKLAEQLSPELRIIDRLRHGVAPEATDDFLLAGGPGEHRLALRVGLNLWPSRTLLQSLDIEQVDLWRLLTALPVNAERVRDLLAIEEPACRAVFGLCTPGEWQGVRHDKILERLVLDARRHRPLTFPTGSDS